MVPLMYVCWCHQCLQQGLQQTPTRPWQYVAISCCLRVSLNVRAIQPGAAGGAHAAAIQVCSLVAETPQLAACILCVTSVRAVVSKAPHTVVLLVI